MRRIRTRISAQIAERAKAAGFIHQCAAPGCAAYTRHRFCNGCEAVHERNMTVYFVGVPTLGNVVKIGQTKFMNSRLDGIRTGCPYPPEVLATVRADGMLERELHAHFAEYRIHLEWFRLEPPLQEIVDLARGGQLQEAVDKSFAAIDQGGTFLELGECYPGTKMRKLIEKPVQFPSCAGLIKYARELRHNNAAR